MRLACEDLTISYQRHPVLHHITCELKLGATTAIIGPNGSGKSTFLKAILGEVVPDTGRVILEGITKNDIAYLPQVNMIDYNLPLTVEDVVCLGAWYRIGLFNGTQDKDKALINNTLIKVGLAGFNSRYVQELSSGQLQRVLLARVIMQQAKIIILDEPFNALDVGTVFDLLNIIKGWQQEGKTIIAVLHDLTQVVDNFEYTMLLAKDLIIYDVTQNVLHSKMLSKAYDNNLIWLKNTDVCEVNSLT